MPGAVINTNAMKGHHGGTGHFQDKEKPAMIRQSNMQAARAVADAVRSSLGPNGMDKIIQDEKGDVEVTNDGATILKKMCVLHPAARMLVDLSMAQDIEAGDGTTSVVVMAGSLLSASGGLLDKGIHPTVIAQSFQEAGVYASKILKEMSIPIELNDRESLIKASNVSLGSKVVQQYSNILSPIAVDSVMKIVNPESPGMVDLRDVKIITKLGGTIEDSEMCDGLVLDQRTRTDIKMMKNAKVGLIQFCISPPKTDMDNQVMISDYSQMDRVLREERAYILNIVKTIKKSGCNVVLVQKSILRDALADLAIHFLNKVKIMVISDIERAEVEFISKTIGARPIASLDHFHESNLAKVDLIEEVAVGESKVVRFTGLPMQKQPTVSVLLRASNNLVLSETERSVHDALCVVRSLVKNQALIPGAGAGETQVAVRLAQLARETDGVAAYCYQAYAEALEIIPFTLAENAALNAIETVTELRSRHAKGEIHAGISVKRQGISNAVDEGVVQPLLVSLSCFNLATECTRSILKIDDIVNVG